MSLIVDAVDTLTFAVSFDTAHCLIEWLKISEPFTERAHETIIENDYQKYFVNTIAKKIIIDDQHVPYPLKFSHPDTPHELSACVKKLERAISAIARAEATESSASTARQRGASSNSITANSFGKLVDGYLSARFPFRTLISEPIGRNCRTKQEFIQALRIFERMLKAAINRMRSDLRQQFHYAYGVDKRFWRALPDENDPRMKKALKRARAIAANTAVDSNNNNGDSSDDSTSSSDSDSDSENYPKRSSISKAKRRKIIELDQRPPFILMESQASEAPFFLMCRTMNMGQCVSNWETAALNISSLYMHNNSGGNNLLSNDSNNNNTASTNNKTPTNLSVLIRSKK